MYMIGRKATRFKVGACPELSLGAGHAEKNSNCWEIAIAAWFCIQEIIETCLFNLILIITECN